MGNNRDEHLADNRWYLDCSGILQYIFLCYLFGWGGGLSLGSWHKKCENNFIIIFIQHFFMKCHHRFHNRLTIWDSLHQSNMRETPSVSFHDSHVASWHISCAHACEHGVLTPTCTQHGHTNLGRDKQMFQLIWTQQSTCVSLPCLPRGCTHTEQFVVQRVLGRGGGGVGGILDFWT